MENASASESRHTVIALVGPFTRGEQRSVQEAASQCGAQVRLYRDEQDAIAAMDRYVPCAVFLHPDTKQEAVYAALRGDPKLFAIPTVETLRELNTVSMKWAMRRGADDVVQIADVRSLCELMGKLIGTQSPALPPVTAGKATVAHFDERKRLLVGRAMRLAGFDVDFIANRHELLSREPSDLLVVSEELWREANFHSKGSRYGANIVITSQSGPVDYSSRTNTVFVGEVCLHHDVVFLAEEFRRVEKTKDKERESRRLLYSAMCTFRIPGGGVRHGYVYNISREGMFIRTLTPHAFGSSVWIEMEPYESGLVHLRGEVAWKREHASSEGRGPAGFGVRLIKEECPPLDLAAYQHAYRNFQEATERGDDDGQMVMVARIADANEDAEISRETIPTKQPTVLVIDDENAVCRAICRRLEKAGYLTIAAGNGEEGLAHLREREVHAVVSDITMPVLNGLELVNEMQSFASNVPVILLSGGYLSNDSTKDASKLVFDFLPKPIPSDKLLATVATAVRAYQTASRGRSTAGS